MRGVVSLAAAFALPTDMPERDLVLFITFCVIVATLLLQGLTLPTLVRRLGLVDDGAAEQMDRDVAVADHHVARVGLAELERLADQERPAETVVDELRGHLEERVRVRRGAQAPPHALLDPRRRSTWQPFLARAPGTPCRT
ncbi:MAG: hypothetical protein M3P91_03910 [Actinomycetota bacterium]|nr:hypothetical protein [Actinomycetota bacterium]